MVYEIIPQYLFWVVFHPLYNPKQPFGPFFLTSNHQDLLVGRVWYMATGVTPKKICIIAHDLTRFESKGSLNFSRGVFPKIMVPQNGWFIVENPIKMDDLGVPLFSETARGHPSSKKKILAWPQKSGLRNSCLREEYEKWVTKHRKKKNITGNLILAISVAFV